jgi:hypothetical protein
MLFVAKIGRKSNQNIAPVQEFRGKSDRNRLKISTFAHRLTT